MRNAQWNPQKAKGGGENKFASARLMHPDQPEKRLASSRTTAGYKTLTLQALACQLANTTNGFSLFTSALLGRLLVEITHLHFTEDTFALHLLLQSAKRLIDVVIAD